MERWRVHTIHVVWRDYCPCNFATSENTFPWLLCANACSHQALSRASKAREAGFPSFRNRNGSIRAYFLAFPTFEDRFVHGCALCCPHPGRSSCLLFVPLPPKGFGAHVACVHKRVQRASVVLLVPLLSTSWCGMDAMNSSPQAQSPPRASS